MSIKVENGDNPVVAVLTVARMHQLAVNIGFEKRRFGNFGTGKSYGIKGYGWISGCCAISSLAGLEI